MTITLQSATDVLKRVYSNGKIASFSVFYGFEILLMITPMTYERASRLRGKMALYRRWMALGENWRAQAPQTLDELEQWAPRSR